MTKLDKVNQIKKLAKQVTNENHSKKSAVKIRQLEMPPMLKRSKSTLSRAPNQSSKNTLISHEDYRNVKQHKSKLYINIHDQVKKKKCRKVNSKDTVQRL